MDNNNDFTETKNVTINPNNIDFNSVDFTERNVVSYFENEPKRYKI